MVRSTLAVLGLFVLSTLTQARLHRRNSEECDKLYTALKGALDKFDGPRKCALNKLAGEVFEIDITNDETLRELVCLATDNSENSNTLFQAAEQRGIVDKVVPALFSVALTMHGPQLLGMMRTLEASAAVEECLAQMPRGRPPMLPPGFESIDRAVFGRIADAIEDLGILAIAGEKGELGMILSDRITGSWWRSRDSVAPVCECSAIIDPQERCRILQDAAAPLLQLVSGNMQMQMMIQGAMMMVAQATGVQLIENFETDVPRLLCEIAQIQQVEDFKGLTDGLGITQPLLEMAFTKMGNDIIGERYRYSYKDTIRSYENYDPEEAWSWRPEESDYNEAKAMLAFFDAYEESGLACLKLTYAPDMVATQLQNNCPVEG